MKCNNDMTLQDRKRIRELYYQGYSYVDIGKDIGYSDTAVRNEIKNRGTKLQVSITTSRSRGERRYRYDAIKAHNDYLDKKAKKGKRELKVTPHLWNYICECKVSKKQSFEQILADYKNEYKYLAVPCLKTIYNYFEKVIKANGAVLNFKLNKKGKNRTKGYDDIFGFGIAISNRPEDINDRSNFGHFEIDCIESSRNENTALLVITERLTRFVIIYYLDNHDSLHVNNALRSFIKEFKIKNIKSITTDNGKEFARLNEVFDTSIIPIYFCEPGKPWQKGTVERRNRDIRKFLPKGTDFSKVSISYVKEIEDIINSTYMKLLNESSKNCIIKYI